MASTSSQASISTSSSPQPSATNTIIDGNLFPMNGSPTMIVAFMAIGLFTVTMTILFAWRKMRMRGRLSVQPVRPPHRAARKPILLGEKPVLWDSWTRRGAVMVDTSWENITPLSVMVLSRPTVERGRHAESRPLTPPRAARPSYVAFISAAWQYLRPSPPLLVPPAHELDEMPTGPGPGDPVMGEGSPLMMAFTIAMPFQRRSVGSDPSDHVFDDTALGEYCIGSIEVPYSRDSRMTWRLANR